MNNNKLVLMALQSRATVKTDSNGLRIIADNIDIEKFADLIRAAAVRETSAEYRMGWNDGQINEREACAGLCYQLVDNSRETRFAAAIRARSNT